MPRPPRPPRGPAAEAVGFRINEGPPQGPRLAHTLTWLGEGVVEVPGVGVFARDVTAWVSPELAARYAGQPGWRVEGPAA